MAYLKKDDIVLFKEGNGTIQSLVTDVRFRRYRGKYTDKKTGEKRMKWKAMPYAICKVFSSNNNEVKVSQEFLIAGYKLRNTSKQGKKVLVLHDKYIAEFQGQWGAEWASRIIEESQKFRNKEITNEEE